MNRNRVLGALLGAAFLAAVAIGYNNCGHPSNVSAPGSQVSPSGALGTNTGNPMHFATIVVRDSLCAEVVKCVAGIPMQLCQTVVDNSPGIDTEIGLPQGTYPIYTDAEAAEAQGKITPDWTATNQCHNDFQNLACQFVQANISGTPLDFSFVNISNLFPKQPGSCPSIFSGATP